MKTTHLRLVALLAVALGLSACGGKASFDVSGSISGLSDNGLVLTNNGDTVKPVSGATSFTFPNRIDYGTAYAITLSNPIHQTCSISGGSGTAGHFSSISAAVVCVQNTHALSGSVSGLGAGTLVLTNGSTGDTITVTGNATVPTPDIAFQFGVAVADGTSYSVGVLTQPATLKCVVDPATGAGVMALVPVTNVKVTCK